MALETLTILRSFDCPAAKTILPTPTGLQATPLQHARVFDVEVAEVDCLATLGQVLRSLEKDPQALVVRGKLIEGRPSTAIRRTLKPKENELPNFEPAARRWCMLDIDNVPLPEEFAEVGSCKDSVIRYATEQLPQAFHGIDCWYQFSASMGIKKDLVRVHLWYWLDRAVTDEELKGWLQDVPVDLALFNPVQPHYTAAPVLADGVQDPLPQRSGFFRAGGGRTGVSVPDRLPAYRRNSRTRRSGGVGGGGSSIIYRDPATGLISDGRRSWMLRASNDAMREAVQSKAADTPDVEAIAERTWEIFQAEADLSDGKWSKADAAQEAANRIEEYRAGTYDFTGKQLGLTLYPADGPYVNLEPVGREEGMEQLDAALSHFFARLPEKAPKTVLRVTMGAGKTRQTVAHLTSWLRDQYGKRIEIYVPRHDLAAEYADALGQESDLRASVVHVQPRTGGAEGKLPVLCNRAGYVRTLERAGVGVFQHACRSNDGFHCIHFDDCPYLAQFRDPEITDRNGNVVRVMVHSYLGLPRNPIQTAPDLIIIDEAFLGELIKEERLPLREVRNQIKSDRLPKLGRVITDALQDGEPLLTVLRDAGVAAADIGDVDLQSIRPHPDFDRITSRPAGRVEDARLYRGLTKLLRVIHEELQLSSRAEAERVLFDPRKEEVLITYLQEPDFLDGVPLLMLDATADETLLEEILGPIEFVRIDIQQRAWVTQVYDRTGSNDFWDSHDTEVSDLVTVLNAWAEVGEIPLVVSHKKLADTLRGRTDLDEGVLVEHFANLRGSNAAKDASAVIITGRNAPPPPSVDLKARAVFWAADEPLRHDAGGEFRGQNEQGKHLPLQLQGYIQSSHNPRPQSGVYTRMFSDERIEALHQQIREAETAQAIARLRLVHAPYRKQVYLLGNLPVEMPVDRFARFKDLMPDRLERELLKKGNIPLTALGLRKMRPDLDLDEENSRKWLSRSRIRDPERLRMLPGLRRGTALEVKFRVQSAGRSSEQRHLFLLPDVQGERHEDVPLIQATVA
ncbi:hypothetical protein FHS00_003538, partial [Limimaricola variabilis]